MPNRYAITNPNTATVTVPTMQRVGDFLFSFRNSPDFSAYRITDSENGKTYAVKNDDLINAIEIFELK
jgi:uncharacterized protein YkuJ